MDVLGTLRDAEGEDWGAPRPQKSLKSHPLGTFLAPLDHLWRPCGQHTQKGPRGYFSKRPKCVQTAQLSSFFACGRIARVDPNPNLRRRCGGPSSYKGGTTLGITPLPLKLTSWGMILEGKGGIPRFPPYPSSAGAGLDESPVLDRLGRFGHMRKTKTVTQFGHILASWTIIFLTFWGSVSDMASKGGPRVPKGYPRR